MFLVLLSALFASTIVLSILPASTQKPFQLFFAVVSLTAAILTGFDQAKRYPRTRAGETLR
jgi:hypothetical protein